MSMLPMGGQQGEPVLKITVHDAVGPRRLALEGWLVAAWVWDLPPVRKEWLPAFEEALEA
jgi:hypothetical protein